MTGIDDEAIRILLTSDSKEKRLAGYYLADTLYRDYVAVYLRKRCKRKRCSLDEHALADCVQIALTTLLDRAIEGTFDRKDGRVDGFLTTVARYKAIDEIRRRVRQAAQWIDLPDVQAELEDRPAQPDDDRELDSELEAVFDICYEQMQEDRNLVIRIYHELIIASDDGTVDLDTLTKEVNKQSKEIVPRSTVKSRLDRGRTEFRALLKKVQGRDE